MHTKTKGKRKLGPLMARHRGVVQEATEGAGTSSAGDDLY